MSDIPIDRDAVPIDRDAVPIDRDAVHTDRDAVPIDRFAVPIDRFAVPIDRFAVPIDRFAVPIDRFAVPIDRFAGLALDCVHRAYPNQVALRMESDDDVRPPRELTPCFFGCYDWHSAVHGHWLLAVAARDAEDAAIRERAHAAIARSITPDNVLCEVEFLRARPAFERPYGLAWLCALHAELTGSDHADTLSPLVEVAVGHVLAWLPKLSRPTRSGVHSQTAFGLGLFLDWARALRREDEAALFEARARAFFEGDRDYAVHLEPDGEDFLSPSLGAADLMARILTPDTLAAWLDRAMPTLGRDGDDWLAPAVVTDPTDGRLAHLDGLNLSRAWMLRAIGRALPREDPRVPAILEAADRNAERGLASVSAAHYEGSHWLGTFATFLGARDPR